MTAGWRRALAWTRLGLLAAWTTAMYLARLVPWTVARWFPAWERRQRRRALAVWGRGALRILGGRVRCIGAPPEPPYYMVSNHRSYVDIIALEAVAGPVFVAMAEVASWPVLGMFCAHLQTIFIQRKDLRSMVRVMDAMDAALAAGYGVHVFPEAGIPGSGRVEPFRPALLEAAARSGQPVYAAGITYTDREGRPLTGDADRVSWVGEIGFMAHLRRLLEAPGFVVTVRFDPMPRSGRDRKALAGELTEAVRGMCGE